MRAPRRWLTGTAAAACACAVVACGGGAASKPTATPTPHAATPTATARPARTTPAAPVRRGLDRALRHGARSAGATAAQAAVAVRGKGVWSGTSGAARSGDDVFSLASVTKPFIATLALRRVEQGRLALDDTVRDRLGSAVPPDVGRVTVRELLSHTSGLSDYFADPSVRRAIPDPRHRWTEPELLHAIRPGSRPGAYRYSNSDYILLGAILRRI